MRKSKILSRDKDQLIVEQLEDPENWRPHFTRISKKINIAVSTIYERYQRLRRDKRLDLKLNVSVFNEAKAVATAYRRWKKNKNATHYERYDEHDAADSHVSGLRQTVE